MFGFFKRKPREIYAPSEGKIVDITEVNDEVFSTKMVGDGVALQPINGRFCSPIAGVVSKIFATNHAFSIKGEKDIEVMVHIGLDTVQLQGEGFERLIEEGMQVEAGTPIIDADLDYLATHAKSTITPIIISDTSNYKRIEKYLRIVKQGDTIMEVH